VISVSLLRKYTIGIFLTSLYIVMYNEVPVKRQMLLFLHNIVVSGKFIVIHLGKVGYNPIFRSMNHVFCNGFSL
jgi:hypothetical protein